MRFKVPPEKMVRSLLISLLALIAAIVLEWLTIVDASPVLVALLSPIVNYVRELKKAQAEPEPPSPPAEPPTVAE